MIADSGKNPIRIRMLISKESLIFTAIALLLLLIPQTLSSSSPRLSAMKVHPMPKKRNNITITTTTTNSSSAAPGKKLRRLPHVFSRVLELPFRSDAEVSIEESADSFRFVAGADRAEFRAHTVEIHPGVTKVVVRETLAGAGGSVELRLDDLELDMWRFRLPETTRPELASAVFVDGELIVTVPKGGEGSDVGDGGEVYGNGGFGGAMGGRLVLVQ